MRAIPNKSLFLIKTRNSTNDTIIAAILYVYQGVCQNGFCIGSISAFSRHQFTTFSCILNRQSAYEILKATTFSQIYFSFNHFQNICRNRLLWLQDEIDRIATICTFT